jgi:hypothetical protein
MNDGFPSDNILTKPIYITTTARNGIVTANLEDFNIIVYEDFMVSLEWLCDFKNSKQSNNNSFCFSLGLKSGKTFYRNVSQDNWKTIPVASVGFWSDIYYY